MALSPWIKHVMKYAKDNNMKFGEALKKAGPSYKSQGNTVSEEPSQNKKSRKMRKSRGKKSSSKKSKTARKWW